MSGLGQRRDPLGLDARLKSAASAVAGFLGDDVNNTPSSGSASRTRVPMTQDVSRFGLANGAGAAAGGAPGARQAPAGGVASGGREQEGLGGAIGGAFSWISQAVEQARALPRPARHAAAVRRVWR